MRCSRSRRKRTVATFDHPSDAIAAALRIQRNFEDFSRANDLSFPFRVRIGLHLGEVVFTAGSAGELVSQHINFAARVMGMAHGGQILVTPGVYEAARGFEFGEPQEYLTWANHGELNLKGLGPTELLELCDTRLRRPQAPSATVEGRRPTALRGIESKDFEIAKRIGHGSMGVVYLAEAVTGDGGGEREVVAIKALASSFEGNPEALGRFTGEPQVISELNHPGIISIRDIYTDGSPPFFAMEWIDGKPIKQAAEGMAWPDIAELMARVCDALGHAHRHSIVHRDLKPSNILVRSGGQPVVLDFGLSLAFDPSLSGKSSSSSGIIGTPLYLSPEQAEGEEGIGLRADIYSFEQVSRHQAKRRMTFVGHIDPDEQKEPVTAVEHHHGADIPQQHPGQRRRCGWCRVAKYQHDGRDQVCQKAVEHEQEGDPTL
jgi:hypothetical protein